MCTTMIITKGATLYGSSASWLNHTNYKDGSVSYDMKP